MKRPRAFTSGGLAASLLALMCWLVATVAIVAQQFDSGWVVAAPGSESKRVAELNPIVSQAQVLPSQLTPTIAPGTMNLQQDLLLRHVLEQTRTPLINHERAAANAQRSEVNAANNPSVRYAARPDGIDGWRAPVAKSAPVEQGWQGPQLSLSEPYEPATKGDEPPRDLNVADVGPIGSDAMPSDIHDPNEAADDEPAADLTPSDESGSEIDVHDDSVEASPEGSAQTAPSAVKQATPAIPPLTPQLVQLRSRVRAVLTGYFRKPLNSRDNDPWEVMHGMLAYGVKSNVLQGGPRGEPITSVGWLCYNKPCKGQTLLHVTPRGQLRAKYGVGLQGHLGQFLAMLAQCRVSADYPIRVGTSEFTIRDLVESEKLTCYPKTELTFKLLALQYYEDLNAKWLNDQGQEWDFPRLIREELAQPMRAAACGGTHCLSAMSLTVKTRARRGEPIAGEYARAAEFVKKHQQYAFQLQNRDGSLSTNWFRGRGDDSDLNRRMKTTGHILEWLCYSLSDEELRDERTIRAVTYLTNLMYTKYNNEWEVGSMCHAIHALLLYDERVFQPFDNEAFDVAARPRPTTQQQRRPTPARR